MGGEPEIHVDCIHGFTQFANQWLDEFLKVRLNASEITVFLAIVRYTYGFKKKYSAVSFKTVTGLSERAIEKALKVLIGLNMIFCFEQPVGPKPGKYGPNKKYFNWVGFPFTPSNRAGKVDDTLTPSNRAGLPRPIVRATPSNRAGKVDDTLTPSNRAGLPRPIVRATPSNRAGKVAAIHSETKAGSDPKENYKEKVKETTPIVPLEAPGESKAQEAADDLRNEMASQETETPPRPMTREQVITAARIKFRAQAIKMFTGLSFGGLPANVVTSIQDIISKPVPPKWTPKEWYTELYAAMEEAVLYTTHARNQAGSKIERPLHLALSRWRTNAADFIRIRAG